MCVHLWPGFVGPNLAMPYEWRIPRILQHPRRPNWYVTYYTCIYMWIYTYTYVNIYVYIYEYIRIYMYDMSVFYHPVSCVQIFQCTASEASLEFVNTFAGPTGMWHNTFAYICVCIHIYVYDMCVYLPSPLRIPMIGRHRCVPRWYVIHYICTYMCIFTSICAWHGSIHDRASWVKKFTPLLECICIHEFAYVYTNLHGTCWYLSVWRISATHCNTLQHTATRCNTLQHTTTCTYLSHEYPHVFYTHCNTLQHTAAHCNTPHRFHIFLTILLMYLTHYHTLQHTEHTATHCNTMQHTATYYNTPQRVQIFLTNLPMWFTHHNMLQHTATHCNTLQIIFCLGCVWWYDTATR